MPIVSVVVPVYNRLEELRRALRSIADQTMREFECIVVDDGSTEPVQSVVTEFDDRFVYLRRETNGGPSSARMTAYRQVQGDLIAVLGSDNEFFPWTFERATHYLKEYPQADAVTGMYVFPDGLHTRVSGGVKVVGPDEFAARTSRPSGDAVHVVRRCVLEEWLQLRHDYFATEQIFTLLMRHNHRVVLVDEPWAIYHMDATERITHRPRAARYLDDIPKFVDEFRPLIGTSPCGPLDITLINMWALLIRAHRYPDANKVARWLRERGISLRTAAFRKALWAMQKRLRVGPRVTVF